MKSYSTVLVIREMKIKTTARCHFTPTRRTKIKKTDNAKFWPGCRATGTLVHC